MRAAAARLADAVADAAKARHPIPCSALPEAWFAPEDAPMAARACRGCPLLVPCGDAAEEYDAVGVWGGQIRGPL